MHMTQEYKRITVAGINGAIGAVVIRTLCEAGFEVQALTRRSAAEKPELGAATVVSVDYQDQSCLETVLEGQDAVISALGDTAGAVAAQEMLINASLAAGVKRFIPSEFGSDTKHPRVRSFPFFIEKLKHQELLRHAAESHPGFSYSIVITGAFLDWGLSVVPFIVNVGNKEAQRFDGGDVPFSTTRVPTLANALVSLLRQPEATMNRTLYIHDAIITQNQLLTCAQSLDSTLTFSDDAIDMAALEQEAWTNHRQAADPLSWIFSFINISIWSREELCAFGTTDNNLLGITELTGTSLDAVVKEEVAKAIAVFAPRQVSLVDSKTAEKAFEDGKKKLIGFLPSSG